MVHIGTLTIASDSLMFVGEHRALTLQTMPKPTMTESSQALVLPRQRFVDKTTLAASYRNVTAITCPTLSRHITTSYLHSRSTMSYGPRMSMAPRTTSHGAHSQRTPAPQENDAFMTLVCAFCSAKGALLTFAA